MRRAEYADSLLNRPNEDSVEKTVGNFPATQAVSGPLTDAELRASSVQTIGERELPGPLAFDPQDVVPAERITRAVPTTDANHGQVHAGNAYSVFVRIASLASGSTADFSLTIPSEAYVHFQTASLTGDGSADLDVYEGSTITKGAAVMSPKNRNRFRADALGLSSVLTFSNVTAVTTLGTVVDGDSLYGGNSRAAVGRLSDENEWVLLDGVEYLFRVTGRAATGFNGTLRLFWYEEGSG